MEIERDGERTIYRMEDIEEPHAESLGGGVFRLTIHDGTDAEFQVHLHVVYLAELIADGVITVEVDGRPATSATWNPDTDALAIYTDIARMPKAHQKQERGI